MLFFFHCGNCLSSSQKEFHSNINIICKIATSIRKLDFKMSNCLSAALFFVTCFLVSFGFLSP